MVEKDSSRRLTIRVRGCKDCKFEQYGNCKHPKNKNGNIRIDNLLYIVPKDCPLDMWDSKSECKELEDVQTEELNKLFGG